jgi:ATP synthase protein I
MSNLISDIEFRFTEEELRRMRQSPLCGAEQDALLDGVSIGMSETSVSTPQGDSLDPEPLESDPELSSDRSMTEFYALRRELWVSTAIFGGIIFPVVWYLYGQNTALNYLLGAVTGLVYLRLLGRNVEQLGTEKMKVGQSHVAVLVGVLIFSTQLEPLHIFPVFMGFLTYKAALLLYTLRAWLTSLDESNA